MRTALRVLATAGALFVCAPTSAWAVPACPLDIALFAPKTVKAGGTFTASASLTNTGAMDLNGLYVQMQLPDYMGPIRAHAPKHAMTGSPGTLLKERAVVFRALRLPARKRLRIKVTVGVPTCQAAGGVNLQGIGYQMTNGSTVTCASTASPRTIGVVRKAAVLKARRAIQGNCTQPPTPEPDQPYVLTGVDQRCLEATLVDTQELGPNGRRELVEAGLDQNALNRCYAACGCYLNDQSPLADYYFNVDDHGQCYCCEDCTPIYAPGTTIFNVGKVPQWYEVDLGNTQPSSWRDFTGSSDGMKLLATGSSAGGNYLYRSVDGGASWIRLDDTYMGQNAFWGFVKCDSTGMKCMAGQAYGPGYSTGSLYRSTDGFASFTIVPSSTLGEWSAAACDADGTNWIIARRFSSGRLYKSNNGGASIAEISGTNFGGGRWNNVACDTTLTTCVASMAELNPGQYDGRLYKTTNSFASFSEIPGAPIGLWASRGAQATPDGTGFIFVMINAQLPPQDGGIFYSSDGGDSWQQADTATGLYYSVACDATLTRCVATYENANYDPNGLAMTCGALSGLPWYASPSETTYYNKVYSNDAGSKMLAGAWDGVLLSYPTLPVAAAP